MINQLETRLESVTKEIRLMEITCCLDDPETKEEYDLLCEERDLILKRLRII